MTNLGPNKMEYDNLRYKLATLESELGQARKLLEAPAKISLWRRLWRMRSKSFVVALVVAFSLVPAVSHALTLKQKALVGLQGVYVLVEGMDPQAEHLGLTVAQIQTDVELRLRKAGIRVLTNEESFATPGMPSLYVNVNICILQNLRIVAYSISVELNESVKLARGFETAGGIWDTGRVGTTGTEKIGKIRGHLGDHIDKFINDYLAANPKN